MNKFCSAAASIFAVLVLVMWCVFALKIQITGDDLTYSRAQLGLDFIVQRWQNWSSRIFIDSLNVLLVSNVWLLRISLFLSLIALALGIHSLSQKQLGLRLCVILSGLFPLWILKTAGWGATFINYFFPSVALLWAFAILLKRELKGAYVFSESVKELVPREKTGVFTWMVYAVLLIFGSNQELCALTALLLFLMMARALRSRAAALSALAIAVILALEANAPGNHARYASELAHWLPEMADWPLWYKLGLGHVRSVSYHLLGTEIYFALLVSAALYLKFKNLRAALAGFLAVAVLQLVLVHGFVLKMQCAVPLSRNDAWTVCNTAGLAVALSAVPLVLWCILSAKSLLADRVLYAMLFLLAIAVPVAVALSPTVFVSSYRVFTPALFVLGALSMWIFLRCRVSSNFLCLILVLAFLFEARPLFRLLHRM